MRTMLKVKMDTTAANAVIARGDMPKVMQALMETISPEAVYFTAEDGVRCGYFVFDMKDASMLPSIAEPLFSQLGASLSACPCMNQDELTRGLEAWAERR
jgi:hypothetical protein